MDRPDPIDGTNPESAANHPFTIRKHPPVGRLFVLGLLSWYLGNLAAEQLLGKPPEFVTGGLLAIVWFLAFSSFWLNALACLAWSRAGLRIGPDGVTLREAEYFGLGERSFPWPSLTGVRAVDGAILLEAADAVVPVDTRDFLAGPDWIARRALAARPVVANGPPSGGGRGEDPGRPDTAFSPEGPAESLGAIEETVIGGPSTDSATARMSPDGDEFAPGPEPVIPAVAEAPPSSREDRDETDNQILERYRGDGEARVRLINWTAAVASAFWLGLASYVAVGQVLRSGRSETLHHYFFRGFLPCLLTLLAGSALTGLIRRVTRQWSALHGGPATAPDQTATADSSVPYRILDRVLRRLEILFHTQFLWLMVPLVLPLSVLPFWLRFLTPLCAVYLAGNLLLALLAAAALLFPARRDSRHAGDRSAM